MEMNTETVSTAVEVLSRSDVLCFLTGAGVSAESGVPTFRGGENIWRGMPFQELSSARMVQEDLPLVWEWFDYRRGVVGNCEPNAGHIAIAEAQRSGRFSEFTLITQNIDGLHAKAGSTGIIELHGNIHQARCLSCGRLQELSGIDADERPPVCSECFDSMRPNVVLFGESLDEDALLEAYDKAAACDVCIVVGTSALVYPAMHIPEIAKRAGAFLIEVNLEETPLTQNADVSLFGPTAEILPNLLKVKNDDCE
jgi:NAD-dependent deacetylase